MWYLHFCDWFTQLFDSPIEVKFHQTTVLLLEQEGLYESCGYLVLRRMHPCGAWAPGRALKNRAMSHQRALFPKIWSISESWQNLFLLRNFAQGIESRQQMHSWTACYPRKGGKLLRSDFLLGIDVIFAFLWSVYPTFWQPNWGQISPDNRITLRPGRALRACGHSW